MDVVNQPLHQRLTTLKALRARAEGVAELALKDGVNHFNLPALTIETLEAGLCHQLSACFAPGVNQLAVAPDGRHEVKRGYPFGIKTGIR